MSYIHRCFTYFSVDLSLEILTCIYELSCIFINIALHITYYILWIFI